MSREFARAESSWFRSAVRPIAFGAALLAAAGCSTATPTSSPERTTKVAPQTTITADGQMECAPNPEVQAETAKLVEAVSKRTDSRFFDVAGVHTVKDDQKWEVSANWTAGTKFGWLSDPARVDQETSYVLTNNNTILMNDHPKISPYGGPYFEPQAYEIVCDADTIKYLGAVLATVPQ